MHERTHGAAAGVNANPQEVGLSLRSLNQKKGCPAPKSLRRGSLVCCRDGLDRLVSADHGVGYTTIGREVPELYDRAIAMERLGRDIGKRAARVWTVELALSIGKLAEGTVVRVVDALKAATKARLQTVCGFRREVEIIARHVAVGVHVRVPQDIGGAANARLVLERHRDLDGARRRCRGGNIREGLLQRPDAVTGQPSNRYRVPALAESG